MGVLPAAARGSAAVVRHLAKCLVVAGALTHLASPASPAQESQGVPAWQGTVVRVVDGDTLWIRPISGGRPVTIRLDGIDAPEICQRGGQQARDALRQRVSQRVATVQGLRRDRYGRLIARLQVGGDDPSAWLVSNGVAWAYQFEVGRGPYAVLQRQAEVSRQGVFASKGQRETPPAFRARHGACYSARRGR